MKYEAPVLKDLLGNHALGANCGNGSTASPSCSAVGGNVDPTCHDGDYAGDSCGSGWQAGPCTNGGSASNCSYGQNAGSDCSDGYDRGGATCSNGGSPGGGSCGTGDNAAGCGSGTWPP